VPVIASSSQKIGVEIAVYNLAQVERALKALAPEVGKGMNTAIRTALNVTRDEARRRIWDTPPMSGWSTTPAGKGRSRGGAGWPAWDTGRMRAGITVNKGQARGTQGLAAIAVAWRLQSTEAAATIFDKATESHSTVGAQFIENLNNRASAQRVLWPAWLKTRQQALQSVEAAIRHAEAVVQSQIDANDAARSA